MSGDEDYPQSHDWRSVHGVRCLVWSIKTTTRDTNRSTKARVKREKEKLGKTYKDTPILDFCFTEGHQEYCDIIIHSNNLSKWENSIRKKYRNLKQDTKSMKGTTQIVFREKTTLKTKSSYTCITRHQN